MSLTEFATLRRKHPDEAAEIGKVEEALVSMVRGNPEVSIDEDLLEARTELKIKILEDYLGELVNAGALEARFALQCTYGRGPSVEANTLSLLPDVVECDRCGEAHVYDRKRVTVFFVATKSFRESVGRR